jgi:hypothetical protein
MPATRDILRLADDVLTAQLPRLGFERQSRGIYQRTDPSADADGWLGLNETMHDGVRLFPFVGVRHRALEAKLAELGVTGDGPSLAVQLGYLAPEGAALSWLFQGETAADEATATQLVGVVEQYALPFFERNRNLQTLAESFATYAFVEASAYAVPVIYSLLGQRELAERSIDDELAGDGSEAGSEYRDFVQRFRESLRVGPR